MYLELGKIAIARMRDIYEADGAKEYVVRAPGRNFTDAIDWHGIDFEDDEGSSDEMQCLPISSLPNDIAGRMSTIQEWVQAGWVDAREGRRLANFPDLEQVESMQDAAEEVILKALDAIADDGEMIPPEPEDDLGLADQLALQMINQGRAQDLEPERIELLRDYRAAVANLKQQAAQS